MSYLSHLNRINIGLRNKIYSKLFKAQDLCHDAKENTLFDLCEYHLDILDDEELTKLDLEQIYKFAADVCKIAKLKINLNPLV